MDLTQDEDDDIIGNIDLPAARAETAATLDPPEIGVHAPPLQETVANEEASRELNGTVIDGQEIKVENALGGGASPRSPLPGPSNKKTKTENIENQRLKCKICLDNEVGVIFLPCRHLISCVSCAPRLRDCGVCRKFIKRKIKAFIA